MEVLGDSVTAAGKVLGGRESTAVCVLVCVWYAAKAASLRIQYSSSIEHPASSFVSADLF